jgi:hypothetical protein
VQKRTIINAAIRPVCCFTRVLEIIVSSTLFEVDWARE